MKFKLFRDGRVNTIPSAETLTAQLELEKRSCSCTPSTVSNYSDALLFGKFGKLNAMGLAAYYSAVQIISNSLAQLPIYVKQHKDNAELVLENNKVANLFNVMRATKFTTIKKLVVDVINQGNGYMLIKRDSTGEPVKLIYLTPNQVSVQYDQYNDDLKYIVTYSKETKTYVMPENMIHLLMNTRDGVTGLSVIHYGNRVIDLANNTEQAATQYFGSGCGINSILAFKGRVTDEAKEKIRSSWQQIHSGPTGSGLAILEGDSTFTPVSSNANDSQMLETRIYNVEEIARLFNISPILLQDLSKSSYNDIEQANTAFVTQTLMPWIEMIQNELTRKLLGNHRNQYFDLDETILMKAKRVDMANYLKTLTSGGIISINEARQMLGMNEMEGASELMIPFTDISQNKINQDTNTEETNTNEEDTNL